jgi:Restriction endonuclease XhoI
MEEFRLRHVRASTRQEAIQQFCCDELAARGLEGAFVEVNLSGAYRTKKWDVGLVVDDEPRLGISCKSIISNHGGTVPNRVDDMLGEAVNLHREWPDAVIGWLFMMSRVDESVAAIRKRAKATANGVPLAEIERKARADGDAWFERLGESVSRASGRVSRDDLPERFEAVSCSLLEFDRPPPFPVKYHPKTPDPDDFFDLLVAIYKSRF